jgi:hypothetical protein
LISPKIDNGLFQDGNWKSPFKKFSRLRVKIQELIFLTEAYFFTVIRVNILPLCVKPVKIVVHN